MRKVRILDALKAAALWAMAIGLMAVVLWIA